MNTAPQLPNAAYAELDVASNFSFLEGASHPEELVERAAQLGLRAIGLADRMTMSGMVRAHVAAKRHGIQLCVGARLEVQLMDSSASSGESLEILAYPTDRESYGRLCRVITMARMRTGVTQVEIPPQMDEPQRTHWFLPLHALLEHSQGLELIVIAPAGGRIMHPRWIEALSGMARIAVGRVSLAVSRLGEPEEDLRIRQCSWVSRECAVPLVVTQGVRFHLAARRPLHDVLTAIRLGTTVAATGLALLPNAQRHLRDADQMHARWREHPQALARSVEIAKRCAGFSLDQLHYRYPREINVSGMSSIDSLRTLACRGAMERYPQGVPSQVQAQLDRELDLIVELKYEPYFLTVYDIVRFARSRSILCQGRGAAANSVVCYCLGVTAVDPTRINLLFERFISKERQEPPDIDIDFEHERREEVIQYIYERYGRERSALCAAVICYRRRLAVRESAKALGFSLDAVDRLVKGLSANPTDDEIRSLGFDPSCAAIRELLHISAEIEGFPRHLSQHPGGFIITEDPLCEMVPIRDAAMDGRTMIEWDKDDIDAMGMLKIDILALGMLTCIRKALDLAGMPVCRDGAAQPSMGVRELALHTIPPEDPATYEMMCRADTVGVFQIESRAQMAMLPRLRPKCYYDLVIEIALVRPGPIQGDLVHPYLRRRAGEELPDYPNEAVRRILERTLGVPLFQEQAMALAIVAAGFTPGEADQLRRSIATWKRSGNLLLEFQSRLIEGMAARGYSRLFAQQVFTQLQGFSAYGFPESHSASFAHLVYASAWLKHHHPAAFAAALLNSQPMGFYAPAQIVQDARRHGVEVRVVDVNESMWDCTLEDGPSLRLGMRMVRGLMHEEALRLIETIRQHGRCSSIEELWMLSGVSPGAMRAMARADAFGSLGLQRQAAIWQAQKLRPGNCPLFTSACEPDHTDRLPPTTRQAEVVADYTFNGLSLKAHPMSFMRRDLSQRGFTPCGDITNESVFPSGTRACLGGLVLLRQRPSTAKGIVFITIEDESGAANMIVRPKVWERDRSFARHASALVAHGRIQHRHGTTHLIVSRMEPLSDPSGQVNFEGDLDQQQLS